MKILITGANGQLGSEIKKISCNFNFDFVFTDVKELDLLDLGNISNKIDTISPDLIINCASYTAVDRAEKEKNLADIINHQAVGIIADWSFKNKRKIIHISTDYVFDGNSKYPLSEDATTSPINFYGYTKLQGENACLNNDPNSIIIRTSWMYSSFGENFVKTMFNLMKINNFLNIINDQIGSPTYAADLAETILLIIVQKNWIPGVYHYSNEGEITWFEFACSIKEVCGFNTQINKILTEEHPALAKRPKYSLMDKTKIKKTFNLEIPFYKDSLKKCLKIIKNEV